MKKLGGLILAAVFTANTAFAQDVPPTPPPEGEPPPPPANAPPMPMYQAPVETKANPVFVAGLGMGISGLIVFTVGGILTISNTVKAHSNCYLDRDYCNSDGKDAASAARTWGWISTGALAVSAVGFIMAVIAPSKKKLEATANGVMWTF